MACSTIFHSRFAGDNSLREKLAVVVDEFSRYDTPPPHFFCASGLRYEEKGPHRPWFTFTRPDHPSHSRYLSDPCFFDDFCGVVIPEALETDHLNNSFTLPQTPQQRNEYPRLQPMLNEVGRHPNFGPSDSAELSKRLRDAKYFSEHRTPKHRTLSGMEEGKTGSTGHISHVAKVPNNR